MDDAQIGVPEVMCGRWSSILTLLSFLWPATGLATALHHRAAHNHPAGACEGGPERDDDHQEAPAHSDDCPICYHLAQVRQAPTVDDCSVCFTSEVNWYTEAAPVDAWPTVARGCDPIIPRAPPVHLA